MPAARLRRVPLDGSPTPQDVLRALADEPWPFALTGSWAGGGAILGARPLRLADPDEDPFALLDAVPSIEGDAPEGSVGGGWFGWIGYGLGARVERLPAPAPRPVPLPPFQLAFYDHVLRQDPDGRWWFEALVTPEREAALEARLAELRARLAAPATAAPLPAPGPFRIGGAGARAHLAAVADCRERIAAGEIFQANVCLRLEAAWDGPVAELFAQASARLEPAYGAAFPAPWGGVASLSPELFLRRRGREAATAPIKGTADRDAGPQTLTASTKDHAEHVMIVDLMRNDLGRVCAYGSVEADPRPTAEQHPGVWHLVSHVRGRLRDGAGDADLVRAAFPPGSVTGAPKVQAMHVIAALESTAREVYTGAIGFASPLAGLELNVAIRTFEARDGRLWLGAGGGIVADSDPAGELEECLVKARPLVEAIGGRIEEPPAAPAEPLAAPPALAHGRTRPDPARGVFETLLVQDGRPVRAAAHLARLSASVASVYRAPLPDDLDERLAATAAEADGRSLLRVVVTPLDGGGVDVDLELVAPRRRALPIALVPFTLPGGLGPHKWRDRRLLEALGAASGATPLLLDGDGAVLEAAWGNVFAVEGSALLTPRADGRLLPGVTRAAVLAAASEAELEAIETELPLARLRTADALLIASSGALVVPAMLDGAAFDAEHAAALAGRLGRLLAPSSVPASA